MPVLPNGWRAPTPQTITEQLHGYEHGLVPASDDILNRPAELVPEDKLPEAKAVLDRMYHVVQEMQRKRRPIVGLAAPQIGEGIQAILVPKQEDASTDDAYGDFLALINPSIIIDETAPKRIVPHGCFSSNEVFSRLPSTTTLELTGVDRHGVPVILRRTGFNAVVDEHEVRHLLGIRAADVALAQEIHLDWRPSEMADGYRQFYDALQQDPTHIWGHPYPPEQWQAVKAGEFVIRHFA